MKIRKIKHRSPKFFGFSDENVDERRRELSDRVQSILQNTTPLLEEDKKHHALLEEIYTELQKGLI